MGCSHIVHLYLTSNSRRMCVRCCLRLAASLEDRYTLMVCQQCFSLLQLQQLPCQQSTWWRCAVRNLPSPLTSLTAQNPGGKACTNEPDYQTPRAPGPPNPHGFPPPHESKSPSSPCQLTAGGKRGEQGGQRRRLVGWSEAGAEQLEGWMREAIEGESLRSHQMCCSLSN